VGLVARGALLIGLTLFVAMAFQQNEEPLELGMKAPHAHLQAYDGRTWELDRFENRPILLNFWATWCGPCIAEMPTLVSISERYASDVVVIGAAVSSPADDVVAAVVRFGIRYPVAAADQATIDRYKAAAIPLTYLLDAEHRVVWSAKGAVSEEALERAIQNVLLAPRGEPPSL